MFQSWRVSAMTLTGWVIGVMALVGERFCGGSSSTDL